MGGAVADLHRCRVGLTGSERAQVSHEARREGQTMSAWMRDAIRDRLGYRPVRDCGR